MIWVWKVRRYSAAHKNNRNIRVSCQVQTFRYVLLLIVEKLQQYDLKFCLHPSYWRHILLFFPLQLLKEGWSNHSSAVFVWTCSALFLWNTSADFSLSKKGSSVSKIHSHHVSMTPACREAAGARLEFRASDKHQRTLVPIDYIPPLTP